MSPNDTSRHSSTAHAHHAIRDDARQFLLLIYSDDTQLDALPAGEFDRLMRGCLAHADELRASGHLLQSQQLEPAASARSVRTRRQRTTVLDGPFAETKEVLAGFNLIEADSMDEAVCIAREFPWTRTGCIEVRPVRDMAAVRRQVGAGEVQAAARIPRPSRPHTDVRGAGALPRLPID
jgi:hypothetical protein